MKDVFKMMTLLTIVLFAVTASGMALGKQEGKVVCPVSGHEITDLEKAPSAEYQGKTYYFCCEGCKEKFMENPKEYLEKKRHDCSLHEEHTEHMEGQHESHECAEEHHAHDKDVAIDPACGMKIKTEDAKFKAEFEGKTYYFCSEECMTKFKKNPEDFIKECEEMVTCPVSGEKVKKSEAVSAEYEGRTFYFGCEGCKAKFMKDPEKYVKKDCPYTKKVS